METSEMSSTEVKERVSKILSSAKTVYLGTNGSHGHPNVRAMFPVKAEGAQTLWFATDLESSKIIELKYDNKAVIYASAPRYAGECRLWGYVDILEDSASRKAVWSDELKKHLPAENAGSPRLRVLRFNVSNGNYRGKGGETGGFRN
jgi:general stress protein 26